MPSRLVKSAKKAVSSFFSDRQENGRLVVLLLGETGSGKSTLINYLTSYFKEGTLTSPRIAIPTQFYRATESYSNSEKDINDRMKSKTAACTNYDFEADGRSFRFIDSPGLSDTGGVDKDDEHIERITQAAERAGVLSGMVVVINGTCSRATVNLRNSLSRLRGILPDILADNLIIMLTNCSRTSYNFDFASLQPWKIKQENIFFMNNSALSRDPRMWQDNDNLLEDMEYDWKKSMHEIDELLERISSLDAKSTGVFKNMRQHRDQLKQELHGILLEIDKLQKTQDELEDAQRAYHGATDDVKKYSNFKQTREVEYTELVPADYHSTICLTHKDSICHEGCGLAYKSQADAGHFSHCACMSGGVCDKCGCGPAQHYHGNVKLGQRKETVEDILQDVQANYNNATQRADDWKKNTSKLQSDLIMLQKALHNKQARVEQCCRELKAICSAFNFADEMNSIVQTMEANARTLTSLNARQEADNMIRSIKQLVDQLKPQGGKVHDQYYKDIDSHISQKSRPGFQRRKGEADAEEYSDREARDRRSRDGYKQSHDDRLGEGSQRADRYPDAKAEESVHACPEFNRGQPCSRRPCPFKHQCLLCDGLHGAVECRNRGGSQNVAPEKEVAAQKEAPVVQAHMQMMEQMQMQMKMLQQMQLQVMQNSMQPAGSVAMPQPVVTNVSGNAVLPRTVGTLPPGGAGTNTVNKPGLPPGSTSGSLASSQQKVNQFPLKPYVPK